MRFINKVFTLKWSSIEAPYRVLLKALTAFCQVLRSSRRLICFSVMTMLKYLFKSCSPAILRFAFLRLGIRKSSLPESAFILTRDSLSTMGSMPCINCRVNPVNKAQFCSVPGENDHFFNSMEVFTSWQSYCLAGVELRRAHSFHTFVAPTEMLWSHWITQKCIIFRCQIPKSKKVNLSICEPCVTI